MICLSEIEDTYELQQTGIEGYHAVKELPQIGAINNLWRQRWVSIHSHPTRDDLVFTIGLPIHNPSPQNAVVCLESKDLYSKAIKCWPEIETYR